MKKYNFDRLPKSWGIWLNNAKNNSRFQEFKEIYRKQLGSKDSDIFLNSQYCGIVNGDRILSVDEDSFKEIITIDLFFALIEGDDSDSWEPKFGDRVFAIIHDLEVEGIFLQKWKNKYVVDTGIDDEIDINYYPLVKPYENTIPYLSEIEALIQKSNKESDFSVITYNVEKK